MVEIGRRWWRDFAILQRGSDSGPCRCSCWCTLLPLLCAFLMLLSSRQQHLFSSVSSMASCVCLLPKSWELRSPSGLEGRFNAFFSPPAGSSSHHFCLMCSLILSCEKVSHFWLSSEFGREETFNLKCRYKEQDRSTEGPVWLGFPVCLFFLSTKFDEVKFLWIFTAVTHKTKNLVLQH